MQGGPDSERELLAECLSSRRHMSIAHFFLGVMNPRSVNLRELNWLVCSEVGFPSESLAFEDGKYG